VIGSLYTNDFALTDGTLIVSNGNLPGTLIFTNVVVAGNKVSDSSETVSGTINASTGILNLTIKLGKNSKISAKGVVLENTTETNAAGWFQGTDQSGSFLLQP